MLNELIINRLKEIIKFHNIIKTDDLYYKLIRRKILLNIFYLLLS